MNDTLEIVVTEWAPSPLELVEPARLARPTRRMDPDVMREYALEVEAEQFAHAPTEPAMFERAGRTTRPEPPRSLADTAAEWEAAWLAARR